MNESLSIRGSLDEAALDRIDPVCESFETRLRQGEAFPTIVEHRLNAIHQYREALRINPRFVDACISLVREGKFAEAKKYFPRARELSLGQGGDSSEALQRIQKWIIDWNLKTVRDEQLLARLPPDEESPWQSFWVDVNGFR